MLKQMLAKALTTLTKQPDIDPFKGWTGQPSVPQELKK